MKTFFLKILEDNNIQNIALKNISQKALVQISYVIDAIIKIGYFPLCWKTSMVLPILKPGKNPVKPGSYRPISLLSSLSKIIERIILSRIKKYEKQQKQISMNNLDSFTISGNKITLLTILKEITTKTKSLW